MRLRVLRGRGPRRRSSLLSSPPVAAHRPPTVRPVTVRPLTRGSALLPYLPSSPRRGPSHPLPQATAPGECACSPMNATVARENGVARMNAAVRCATGLMPPLSYDATPRVLSHDVVVSRK